jgi:hypothetical protein
MGSSEIDRIIAEIEAANQRQRLIHEEMKETVEVMEELPPSDGASVQVGEGCGPRVIATWSPYDVAGDD